MKVRSPLPRKRARIEIIPLIDIMFFLLASFMMVSLSQTHMKGIRVNLPAMSAPTENPPKDYVAIRVTAGNNIYFDNVLVAEGDVLPRLYQLHQANPGIKVSLSAEEQALHGDVITVLDHVRSVGITKVGYQIKAVAPH
jgi:biopolymer transport protein ExbD